MDLLGRRWSLRVIWELRAGGRNFRALQAACGNISPSVLQARLHELQGMGAIEKIPRLGYRLSASGERLYQCLEGLGEWAEANPGHLI
jgi:DNA-binding HxlR family transcriptional regulator